MLTGNEVFQEGDGYATLMVFATAAPLLNHRKANVNETKKKLVVIVNPCQWQFLSEHRKLFAGSSKRSDATFLILLLLTL
jgi:hypothetical protein